LGRDEQRAAPQSQTRQLVLVDFFETRLVRVVVGVGLPVVIVLMLVLDVLVLVGGVCVRVGRPVVLVLVRVWFIVSVLVGHGTPVWSVWRLIVCFGPGPRRLRGRRAEMFNVAERLVEQRRDMRVVEGVDRLPADPTADHEPEVPKDPELVGDCRLGHRDCQRQICHGARALAKASEDPDAAPGPQGAHQTRDALGVPGGDRRR